MITTTDIEYDVDGTAMIGRLAVDDGHQGPRPGVLVAHEGPGLTDHAVTRAERLAELGYIAFALDYHGGGVPLPMDQVMARLMPLMGDPDRIVRLGAAGLDVLLGDERTDRTRIGAIGFCFGGTMVLEMARAGADLKAVVGFHAGLATQRPARPGAIRGSVLALIGAQDPLIPAEQRRAFEDEMRAAGAEWQMDLYGSAAHSFTNEQASTFGRPGIEYHEQTDRRSWKAMLDLFGETISA